MIDPTDVSLPLWLEKERIVNERGTTIKLDGNHFFLFEPYSDLSQEQVYVKAAQLGLTTMMILKVFRFADKLNLHTIYTLPSDSDVSELVPTKVNPIVESNQVIKESIDTSVDRVDLRKIGNAYVYFKGTRSKTAPIMTTADLLVMDEKDRSDQNVLQQYHSRVTGADSKFRGVWELSNPSTTDSGVDITWKRSTQKKWYIHCPHCDHWQSLSWDLNVDEVNERFVCAKCKKELSPEDRRLGEWVAAWPQRKVSGYQMNQMMAPWLTAHDLIEQKRKMGLEHFTNFVLGEPYSLSDIVINKSLILDNWTDKYKPEKEHDWFLGVDVGREKHFVLGDEKAVRYVGKFTEWDTLDKIIERYDPWMVIDALPETTMSAKYVRKNPRASMCYFKREIKEVEPLKWGKKGNVAVVFADTNRILDDLIDELFHGKLLYACEKDASFEEYLSHWVTLRRVKETDASGIDRYFWESQNKQDHYVLSSVYYKIARSQKGAAQAFLDREHRKPAEVIEHTTEGFVMNIPGYIEDQQQ